MSLTRAIIHGTVAGRIFNKGGRVELFGVANGIRNLSLDAVTIVGPGAAGGQAGRKAVYERQVWGRRGKDRIDSPTLEIS